VRRVSVLLLRVNRASWSLVVMQHLGSRVRVLSHPTRVNLTTKMSNEQNGETTGSHPEADFAQVQESRALCSNQALTVTAGDEGAPAWRANCRSYGGPPRFSREED
jgi:hypothetical protein